MPPGLAQIRDEAFDGYLFALSRPGLSGRLLRHEHAEYQNRRRFYSSDYESRSSLQVFEENLGNVVGHAYLALRVAVTPATLISGFMMRQIEHYGSDVDQWRMEPFLPK